MLTGRQVAILAIMLTAVSPSLFKVSDLPVLQLVFWRLILATILYSILFVCTRQRPKWIEVQSGFWGGLSFAGQLVLYAVAVRHTSVANAMEPTLRRNVAFLQQLNMQLRSICSILMSMSRRQML